MSKYFSYITVITIILLVLVSTNMISLELFLLGFAPLSLAMLVVGIIELKDTINNKDDIESKALKLKSIYSKR